MEASVAANGGQGEGQAADGQQQAGFDAGQVTQQLEALAGGQEELRQFLQSQPWAQQVQEQQEAGGEDFDLSEFLDLDSPTFDPQQVASSITQLVDQAAEAKLAPALEPLAQQLQQIQDQRQEDIRKAEAYALVDEFPELGDRQVAQEVVQTAREYAEQNFPPQVAEELAKSPAFWRAMYMAGRAADAANAEGQDVQTAVLEGGSGARPGADPSQLDQLGDAIVNGGRAGRGVLPFG